MKIIYMFIFLFTILCNFHLIYADIIIVDINGTGNYTSIQEGIDNSTNNDTILVYPGTYFENINYKGKNILVASLYVTSQNNFYINSTIIDGNQNGSVVTFNSGEDSTAVLRGFTLQNGSGVYYNTVIIGGGVFINYAESQIMDCIIKDNIADVGGGIAIDNGQTNLKNVTICNNHGYVSGGGINLFDSYIEFNYYQRCNIYNNYAGRGCDINIYETPDITVNVDTFTVLEPNSHFAYNRGPGNITFNILNSKITPVDYDLYVSSDGDNNNSGLIPSDPLRNLHYALNIIASDSLNPKNIYVSNGIYSPSLTGEKFALNCREYISIIGENEETTIFNGEELSNLIIAYTDDNFSIENVTLKNGKARLGGGMYINNNSNPVIKNATFKNNFAEIGTHIYIYYHCNPIFENVDIVGMSSLVNDVAIFLVSNSDPAFINCSIENNHVDPNEYFTGAIDCDYQCSPILINTKINNNSAVTASAITIYGGTLDEEVTLINCTISDNSNCSEGAIRQLINTNLVMINCILRNDALEEIWFLPYYEPDTVTISYTNIEDSINGINTNNNGTIIWGEGNMDEDPLFVGGDPFSYELSVGSPCIDAGTPDTTGLNLPATDLAGNPRIFNGRIDIGCYECQDTISVYEPDTSFIHNLYLFQNTPNPFTNETEILFITADYERVGDYSLSIYNTKGQLVRRFDGSTHDFWVKTKIVWDGTDEQGKEVAPGTYLYKLEYNGNAVVRKMVKIR